MSGSLNISLSFEALDSGSPEEQATFGLFAMTVNDRLFTQGIETDSNVVRHGPHVSGYALAEWLVWNWWRIRWEFGRPREAEAARRWDFSHQMLTVGDGYVWPNIVISSDGINAFFTSRQTSNPNTVLFRYLGAYRREVVSALVLEEAIDEFVADILARLEDNGLPETNLHCLWRDLTTERASEEFTRYRRLEALLGFDPDDADEGAMGRRLEDAAHLGERALEELAADAILDDDPLNGMAWSQEIIDVAGQRGFDARPSDAIELEDTEDVPHPGTVEAWRLGEGIAHKVRLQEDLDGERVSNEELAQFAGTVSDAISDTHRRSQNFSFALDEREGPARVSLRSRWVTGRRFELARLIGDRLVNTQIYQTDETLFPATRSYSYRQKMQRAFAAELLSPFAAVDEMAAGDYSEEKQNEIARYFKVSPMTLQAQLVNNGRLRLEDAPDIFGRGASFSSTNAA